MRKPSFHHLNKAEKKKNGTSDSCTIRVTVTENIFGADERVESFQKNSKRVLIERKYETEGRCGIKAG
jgi:hypothetical protein